MAIPEQLLMPLILFFAASVQSLTGFGQALVAMPLLAPLLGVRVAAPLVALLSVSSNLLLLISYRNALDIKAVWRLSAASLLAIPLGVWGLRRIDEAIVTALLGVVITGYALYAFFTPRLPEIQHPLWAYGFGFVAGLLSGAYSTSGPPVVIYGSCRRWNPTEFKSNLQAFFLLNNSVTLGTHVLSGSYTPFIWQGYLLALPAVVLGLWLGSKLSGHLDPSAFRKTVLVLLMVLGLRLIF